MKFALVVLAIWAAVASAKTYEGHVVLRTGELTASQSSSLRSLQSEATPFDFWKDPLTGHRADIMSPPDSLQLLKDNLASLGVDFKTYIGDVEKFIQHTEGLKGDKIARSREAGGSPRYNLDWDDYYSHDDINAFLDELAATYDNVDSIVIGQTYEGRDQKVIALTRAGPGAPNFWIEAAFHAREWIAPAVATYLIRELVENDAAHPEYLDNLNIYIMPVGNPDGYEYTRAVGGDRLWRKTRSFNEGSACLGTDANRNFEYHWGESGTSDLPCGDTYHGASAFSEIETANMRDFYLSLDPLPVVSHSLHSAAELWLYPFGYASDTFPDNVQELIDVANECVDALYEVNGIQFTVESLYDLYIHSGTSPDWYKSLDSRFVYTTELRDQGYSFLLPADQIIPSGEEMWAAEQVLLNKAIETAKKEKSK